MNRRRIRAALSMAGVCAFVLGCGSGTEDGGGASVDRADSKSDFTAAPTRDAPRPNSAAPRCDHYDADKSLFWGELHVHTGLSSDAWRSDVRTSPDDAYRFARGHTISIPPLDPNGQGTQRISLARPLDFAAVTDHAETLGALELCKTPGAKEYDSIACDYYRRLAPTPGMASPPDVPPAIEVERMLCGEDFERCATAAITPWEEITTAAARWNDPKPSCEFTTFVAFEWSGALGGPLLHRNVIFKSDSTPLPMGSRRAPRPWNLWRYLESTCLEADIDCDVLAIPHNSNTSSGQMFVRDYPGATTREQEASMARRRLALEPVIEIMQHKGDSECRNGLAGILGDPDELCGFEKLFPPQMPECASGGPTQDNDVTCVGRGGYARTALASGLSEAERIGVNPFEFGFIAATDTHNANAGDVDEATWKGHVGNRDGSAATRMGTSRRRTNAINNPGGIAAVWSEENSREALFEAIRRKETYGTSGPRIAVRFFAGWDYPADMCERDDFVRTGYAQGVPMGGQLGAAPSPDAAPVFAIHAQADPGTPSSPGGQLQKAQIIKVWNDSQGKMHQRIFDVAGTPNSGADVDRTTCEPRGPGARELCQVWSDPEFERDAAAVYYARVVENPSCRWQTRECLGLAGDDRPAICDGSPLLEEVIQERAWTSPIWYAGD